MAVESGKVCNTSHSPMNLMRRIIDDFTKLLTYHFELFKVEAKEEAMLTMKTVSFFVLAIVVGYTAIVFLGLFLIFILSNVVSLWLAALIVALFYIAVSIVALITAKSFMGEMKHTNDSVMRQTFKTMEVAKKCLQNLK